MQYPLAHVQCWTRQLALPVHGPPGSCRSRAAWCRGVRARRGRPRYALRHGAVAGQRLRAGGCCSAWLVAWGLQAVAEEVGSCGQRPRLT